MSKYAKLNRSNVSIVFVFCLKFKFVRFKHFINRMVTFDLPIDNMCKFSVYRLKCAHFQAKLGQNFTFNLCITGKSTLSAAYMSYFEHVCPYF